MMLLLIKMMKKMMLVEIQGANSRNTLHSQLLTRPCKCLVEVAAW